MVLTESDICSAICLSVSPEAASARISRWRLLIRNKRRRSLRRRICGLTSLLTETCGQLAHESPLSSLDTPRFGFRRHTQRAADSRLTRTPLAAGRRLRCDGGGRCAARTT